MSPGDTELFLDAFDKIFSVKVMLIATHSHNDLIAAQEAAKTSEYFNLSPRIT